VLDTFDVLAAHCHLPQRVSTVEARARKADLPDVDTRAGDIGMVRAPHPTVTAIPVRRVLRGGRRAARRLGVEVAHWRLRVEPRRSDAELLRRAGGDLPTLIRSFRAPTTPRFFFAPGQAPAIAAELERTLPGWGARTVADAGRICDHVVRVLGSDALALGRPTPGYEPIPWHEDATTGFAWDPGRFYRRIEVPYGRADIKFPWELSRCQHLPTLGMAHLASGDERYACEVVAQIDDWIAANPPGYGVNWACAMDVALRAINWAWATQMIAAAAAATDEFLLRLLASLVVHARHVSRNVERYAGGLTTNHTLADHAGLLHLGLLLRDLPEAAAWIRTARAGLEEGMRSQVGADGVDFESSIAYHRLALELLAGSHILAEVVGRPLSADYRSSLRRMFEFVRHYTRPDGRAPLIGDADDGRMLILASYFDWDPQDHRYLLGLGGALFSDEGLARHGQAAPGSLEHTAWLLGPAAARWLARSRTPPTAPPSHAFRPSGRYVMRAGGHHAVICADEVGTAGLGNHKHNDVLAYELSVNGVAMIVDCGSYTYTADPAWRDRFRSTRAHNTLVVDGEEQNEPTGPFGMRRDARVRVTAWRTEAGFDRLEAEHTGYERLAEPVTHRRRIVLAKRPFAWIAVDDLRGEGEHAMESSLHLAPGGQLRVVAIEPVAMTDRLRRAAAPAGLEAPPEGLPANGFSYSREGVTIVVVPLGWPEVGSTPGWFAPRYGQRVPVPVLRFRGRGGAGVSFGCLIVTP
jgi:hypothetical protein